MSRLAVKAWLVIEGFTYSDSLAHNQRFMADNEHFDAMQLAPLSTTCSGRLGRTSHDRTEDPSHPDRRFLEVA